MDIGFDWVLAMRIYLYVFYASLAVRLIISAFKCFLSYLRSHWTPTGLISSGLEQLEAQADLIAQIEVQRESGNPPIPPECSLGYLEALREVRKGYITLLKDDQKKFQSASSWFHMSISDQDVLKEHLKCVQDVEELAESMEDALITWIRRDMAGAEVKQEENRLLSV